MTPPKRLVRVEWDAARHPERPLERSRQSRNFTSREHAGDQVLSIRRIAPRFAELVGVWECSGGRSELDWQPVDPDTLPCSDGALARDRAMRRHSEPLIAMMEGDPE